MPAPDMISVSTLARLTGAPDAPRLIDVREPAGSERIPGATRRLPVSPEPRAVVIDETGGAAAHAIAARLRHDGIAAEVLEGGQAAWTAAGLPLVPEAALVRDAEDRSLWVTRGRPKVDRIACPWLIRRFVDPHAVILFVAPGEVQGVAAQTGAAPFDIAAQGVRWTHRGELCTFDVMIEELGLGGFEALTQLAPIVRGADTARLDLAPEAAGLLAVSLGLSRLHADDHAQLDAGMAVYDALFRWARDAREEKHDWTSHQPRGGKA
ncbi:chromate resistance protein [Sphingomonas sp. BT-65]|uniref:chromate resistance protein ChrB domain-containing protein n=1 Tax=Sphingomonas sp. BT-65 TaxID=2989821 RepID=UPI002235D68B|nr:chromate resistance protein ChrB domain-containing protein [Sphingomonas sp. BT-65]MCW4461320.1 chromate resistance protein [Sphingomonas sp. BT-65]